MTQMQIEGDARVDEIIDRVRAAGGRVVSVVPHRETLEDVFVRDALGSK
jgi:ABC-2 type transport system ATP-binding protein